MIPAAGRRDPMNAPAAPSRKRYRALLRRGLLLLLAVPLLYLAAALVGALVPRNAGWEEPLTGIEVFVRTNGVHADLVLPASAAGVDWYAFVPPEHVPDPGRAQGYVGLGWGHREFYLTTPTWSDLSPGTALRGIIGGEALMRVTHLSRPVASADDRPVRLPPDAYRRLAAAIRADFARGSEGRPIPLLEAGYGDHDVFYEARGYYSALRTSNQWTADMLAAAGVRVGVWTPFAQGLMWRFRTGPDDPRNAASLSSAISETALKKRGPFHLHPPTPPASFPGQPGRRQRPYTLSACCATSNP